MQQLNDHHQLTIDAFRTAIEMFKQNGKPLPDEISAIVHDLENNIAILDRLTENHPDFEIYYQNARLDLQAESAERNKRLNSPTETTVETQPIIRHQPSQDIQPPRPLMRSLDDRSTNGISTQAPTKISSPQPPFPTTAKETILKKLTHTPLRTQDLSYVLNQPLDRTQTIVQQLWKSGYIDRLDTGVLQILIPSLRSVAYRNQSIDPNLFLTITAKGYSHLYPVFQWAKRGEQ